VVSEHRARQRTLETQANDLAGRYPDGMDTAKNAVQLAFAQAEARVVATKADLPPDFEKLPERNKRAAAALQQLVEDRKTVSRELNRERLYQNLPEHLKQKVAGPGSIDPLLPLNSAPQEQRDRAFKALTLSPFYVSGRATLP
jgi:hypothetical protein